MYPCCSSSIFLGKLSTFNIFVSSNKNISIENIDAVLISKWNWIVKNINKNINKFPLYGNLNYEDGEYFPYLGSYYKLIIENSNLEKIVLEDNLTIYTNNLNTNNIKNKIDNWYENKINIIFNDSFNKNYILFEKYTDIVPQIKFRKMKSSWGNCKMPSGIITLNKSLIYTPLEFIDYVMIHELVHLVHPNHSKNFYNLLDNILPNWRELKNIIY